MICRPTVYTGSSASMGSWNTIDTVRPRKSLSARPCSAITSVPSTRMLPSTRVRPGGCRRSTDRSVTLLPEPDSPSSATTSPRPSVRSTPSSARTGLAPPVKVTVRPLMSRMGSAVALMPHPFGPAVARGRIGHVAGDLVADTADPERGHLGRAHRLGEGAARMEAAARGRIDGVGRVAGERRLLGALVGVHGQQRAQQRLRVGMRGCRCRASRSGRSRPPAPGTSPSRGSP